MEQQRKSSGRWQNPNHTPRKFFSRYSGHQRHGRDNIATSSYEDYRKESSIKPQEELMTGGEFPVLPTVIGVCPHMCPENERSQRERLRDLAVFERFHGNPGRTSPDLAVKKFCRTLSIKTIQPSDVRPLSVLQYTLTYLLNLIDSTDHPFEVVHDFIFDRTRSIRQDISIQKIVSNETVAMLENVVEFHVISLQRLVRCGNSLTLSSAQHLNMEQLFKSLSTLFDLYDENRNSTTSHPKEAEFRSIYLLLHLDYRNQQMGDPLCMWFHNLIHGILHSKEVKFARKVLRYFQLGYYKQFLSAVSGEASYLQCCVLEPYIFQARVLCLSCINDVGYKIHAYPLSHLSKLLMLKEQDVDLLCYSCGLVTDVDSNGSKMLQAKQLTFSTPKREVGVYQFCGFEMFDE